MICNFILSESPISLIGIWKQQYVKKLQLKLVTKPSWHCPHARERYWGTEWRNQTNFWWNLHRIRSLQLKARFWSWTQTRIIDRRYGTDWKHTQVSSLQVSSTFMVKLWSIQSLPKLVSNILQTMLLCLFLNSDAIHNFMIASLGSSHRPGNDKCNSACWILDNEQWQKLPINVFWINVCLLFANSLW